jgi:hypothetical protein
MKWILEGWQNFLMLSTVSAVATSRRRGGGVEVRDNALARGVIRPVTTFDAQGKPYEGWEAYRPDGVLIACSPDKETLKVVLGVLNADIVFVEADPAKARQRSGSAGRGGAGKKKGRR